VLLFSIRRYIQNHSGLLSASADAAGDEEANEESNEESDDMPEDLQDLSPDEQQKRWAHFISRS
jgi:hypothetical protein